MAADIYLPFLEANAAAAARGDTSFSLEFQGRPYAQGTFPYQVKCLAELRRRLGELEGAPLVRTRATLEAAGFGSLLTTPD